MEEKKQVNWFVRSLIVALSLFLLAGVTVSFFLKVPKYEITAGVITIICIVTLLVLSEAFDKLSLGKIMTLSREIGKKKEENKSLKSENAELRNYIVQYSANMQQSQVNTTINATKEFLEGIVGVVKASEVELNKNVLGEICVENDVASTEYEPDSGDSVEVLEESSATEDEGAIESGAEEAVEDETLDFDPPMVQVRLNRLRSNPAERPSSLYAYAEHQALELMSHKYGYIERDMRFSEKVESIVDPISARPAIFDGYCKDNKQEFFFEVRLSHLWSGAALSVLYRMLAKIQYYREAKGVDARLVLILAKIPDSLLALSNRRPPYKDCSGIFIKSFQPAIENKLLRVETVELTEEELQPFVQDGKLRIWK